MTHTSPVKWALNFSWHAMFSELLYFSVFMSKQFHKRNTPPFLCLYLLTDTIHSASFRSLEWLIDEDITTEALHESNRRSGVQSTWSQTSSLKKIHSKSVINNAFRNDNKDKMKV